MQIMCSLTRSLTAIDFKVSLVGAFGVCQLTADYTDPSTLHSTPEPYGVWDCLHPERAVCPGFACVCVRENNKTLDGES